MSERAPISIAVIPAAGQATRFLPASKAIPKELFPLVDKPVLQYALEEIAASGIGQALVITAAGKEAMEAYFDRAGDLEATLQRRGDQRLLEAVQRPRTLASLAFLRQGEPRGLGHAVLVAKPWVGDRPFAVLLPDDLIWGAAPGLAQLIAAHRETGASVLALERVPREAISGYGVVAVEPVRPRFYRITALVEKPSPDKAPSDLAIVGRYVLTPGVFAALEQTTPGARDEIQLTDGIARLLESEPVYGLELEGTRYDTGTPLGFLYAAVALALERPDIGPALREMLGRLLAH